MPFDEEDLDPHGECAAEIARLRAALAACATSFLTEPGTVMNTAAQVAAEFRRRQQLAADALALGNQQSQKDAR